MCAHTLLYCLFVVPEMTVKTEILFTLI